MRISHVALDDFRSYRHVVVELRPGTTVLLGHNGQGKTNLIEAIAYLSTFSSHRVAADGALVRLPTVNSDEKPPGGAVIRVKLVTGEHSPVADKEDPLTSSERVIELEIVKGRANRARVNRTQVRPREILGLVKTVVFAPEDLQIVRGNPSVRRQFLDELATQLRPTLSVIRSDFDRVALQRGAVLKQASVRMRRGQRPDLSTIDVWNDKFCHVSAELSFARQELISQLKDRVGEAYRSISDSTGQLDIGFDMSMTRHLGPGESIQQTPTCVEHHVEGLRAALVEVQEKEIERGVNLVGAHRDDMSLTLRGFPVKGYASHGESWSSALALRLASFDILSDSGEKPILILDDVFAELDGKRRSALADMVSRADQVIVTAAVPEDVPATMSAHRINVSLSEERGTELQVEETVGEDNE